MRSPPPREPAAASTQSVVTFTQKFAQKKNLGKNDLIKVSSKNKYSRLSLYGHFYKTDTSVKRTT